MKHFLLVALWLSLLAFVSACSNDDAPMPAYQLALADLTTDLTGTAYELTLDDGTSPSLTKAITGLKTDTTYRIHVAYLLNDGRAQVNSYTRILAPQVGKYAPDVAYTHPLEVTTCWRSPHYINLQLNVKGTAKSVHYFGFNETDYRTNADGSHTMCVNLIHNQNADPLYYSRSTYLSLPLRPLSHLLRTGTDSIQLTVNTFQGKETYKFEY